MKFVLRLEVAHLGQPPVTDTKGGVAHKLADKMSWGYYQHKCLAQPRVDRTQLLTHQLKNGLLNAWRVPIRLQGYVSYLSAANEVQVSELPSASVSSCGILAEGLEHKALRSLWHTASMGYSVISGADSCPE